MSSFGEIVEPGTRTAWEDWDDNSQEDSQPNLEWHKHETIPTKIHTLFMLEGRHIADSIKSFAKLKLEFVNSIQPVNINLYRSDDAVTYVCVLRDYNLLMASTVVDLLKPYITVSENVLAILTRPIVEYQSTDYRGEEFILRSLSTTKSSSFSIMNTIPKLEQPNIISGVSAGAVALREMNNQPGEVVVVFMEYNEEYQINELQLLLNKFNLGPVDSQPYNSILNSNLYI